ncbi:hypothetical protein [Nocardia sp. NPDC019304]
MATGRYQAEQLLNYSPVDLTSGGVDESMLARDEFNFSVDLQLAEAPTSYIRAKLVDLAHAQHVRAAAG